MEEIIVQHFLWVYLACFLKKSEVTENDLTVRFAKRCLLNLHMHFQLISFVFLIFIVFYDI